MAHGTVHGEPESKECAGPDRAVPQARTNGMTGRMRVLVVTNMYPTTEMPSFGTFVYDQVQALREAGATVDVFYFLGRKSKWEYFWAFPRFWRILARRRYDVIHAHYVLSGIVARAQWGHRVVLTHHGPEVLGQPK